MSYSVYNPCEDEIIEPSCDPCLTEIEHARVRSIALIHKSYYSTLAADPTDAAAWTAGVTAKNIFVIPETQGSFDGGSPVEVAGYGDQATKVIGYNFSSPFKDPNFKLNTGFYNSIKNSGNWHYAWRTESLTRMSSKPISLIPKSPTGDDITAEVVWDVEAKWFERDQPVPFDTPEGVFVCKSF